MPWFDPRSEYQFLSGIWRGILQRLSELETTTSKLRRISSARQTNATARCRCECKNCISKVLFLKVAKLCQWEGTFLFISLSSYKSFYSDFIIPKDSEVLGSVYPSRMPQPILLPASTSAQLRDYASNVSTTHSIRNLRTWIPPQAFHNTRFHLWFLQCRQRLCSPWEVY